MSHAAFIEAAEFGTGFILVTGWLSAPAAEPWPEGVVLRVGEHHFTIGQWFPRADLPDAEDGPRFMAFREDLPWPAASPAAPATLHLDAAAPPLATAEPGRWAPFAPAGALEAMSQASVSGWLFDPTVWHAGGAVTLCLDGAPLVALPLDVVRRDILCGAARRGQPLGFYLGADALGRALDGRRPFVEGTEHRWSVTSAGAEVMGRTLALPPLSRGRLEGFREGMLRGWAALGGHPDSAVTVALAIHGVPFATTRAGRRRDDLARAGITSGYGGFALPLRLDPTGTGEAPVEARVAGEQRLLPGSPFLLRGLVAPRGAGAGPWRGLVRGRPRVAIVVPVHNAPEDLARCLASVVAATGGAARLIVIDDASTDPRVPDVLAPYRDRPGVQLLANRTNLGFTATCNRGIAEAGRDDVVLLNSDAIVPARWLEGLVAAAYAAPDIASATPLSDNAGPFSAPETGIANAAPVGLGTDALSRLVAQAALAVYPDAPTGHGFCLYLRRDALDVIGVLDAAAFPRGYGEENDLCMRALRTGLRNVVDDRTYVRHRRSASFGAAKAELLAAGRAVVDARYPEYGRLVRAFVADEGMDGVRWRIRRAFQAARAPRPRVLFVISTETGGTPQTNLDLMRALEDRYEPWLLRSDGRELTLRRLVDGRLEDVSAHVMARPVVMPVHRSGEYDEVVAEILLRHAIELVHVRHLAWHGLDLPAIARALGIPVVLSLHDFYVACPTIKLLDGALRHCGGRCSAGEGTCRAELWPEDQVPPLRDRFVHRWREMMAPALAACDAFVTTSPTAREIIGDALPVLREADFRVIPHGRSFADFVPPRAVPEAGRALRVLLPGNIGAAKGAELVSAMAALDAGQRVEFHILGDAGTLEAMPGLVLHGRYERDDFLARIADISPDLGAVLSIWPETYSHTLTELWAAGLPVFGLDFGAVGERIRAHGGGWLSAERDPAALLEALAALAADAEGFARRLGEVRAWQQGDGVRRDVHAMAFDYDLLYRDVTQRRRAFPAAPGAAFVPPRAWLRVDLRSVDAPLPPALVNRADGPVVFRPTTAAALPSILAGGQVAGVALLGDDAHAPGFAALGTLCDRHGVAVLLCPAALSADAPLPDLAWPVLPPDEPPEAAEARITATPAPRDPPHVPAARPVLADLA